MFEMCGSFVCVRQEVKKPDIKKAVNPEVIKELWDEMHSLARKENRSLFGISSAVAMGVFHQASRAGRGLYGSVRAGVNLLDDAVLDYYKQGFRQIREKGYWKTVQDTYRLRSFPEKSFSVKVWRLGSKVLRQALSLSTATSWPTIMKVIITFTTPTISFGSVHRHSSRKSYEKNITVRCRWAWRYILTRHWESGPYKPQVNL